MRLRIPSYAFIYASNEAAYFLMGRDNTGDAPLPGIGAHDDKDAPVQVDEPKISEVRVPNNPAHNELLDEFSKLTNEVIFLSVLKACGTIEAIEQARLIHEQIIKNRVGSNIMIGNTSALEEMGTIDLQIEQ